MNIQQMLDVFSTLTNPLTWVRVGVFLFAFMLVLIGMMVLVGDVE